MYSINALNNMEIMLYGMPKTGIGATGMYTNNYMTSPAFMGNNYSIYCQPHYGVNNTNFGQTIPNGYSNETQQDATIFNGLTQKDAQALTDFYAKNLEPSESLKSALLMGGIMGGIMQNPRIIAHPINYLTTTLNPKSQVNKLFKGVTKKGTALNAAWKENSLVMEEAFSQMHRATARSKSKLGLFRARYTQTEIDALTDIMKKALTPDATGKINIDAVAEATEKLRHAYCRNGKIFQGIDWIRTKIFKGKSKLQKPLEMLKETDVINKAKDTLLNYGGKNITLKKAFIKTGGWLGLLFGGVEILMNWNKVTTAKQKDQENAQKGIQTNYGKKQTAQTITKAVTNTLGWCAGETLGIWAFAKCGAAVGTALGPGIGTAIGAVVGFVGGSLGMWLAGRATKKIVGDDVANKIEAENMAQTQDGQLELIQHALTEAEGGKTLDPATQQALQRVLLTLTQQQTVQPQMSYMA